MIGVALMVATLFILMIIVDKTLGWINDQWARLCGGERPVDPEQLDPASLVGSFKRYK